MDRSDEKRLTTRQSAPFHKNWSSRALIDSTFGTLTRAILLCLRAFHWPLTPSKCSEWAVQVLNRTRYRLRVGCNFLGDATPPRLLIRAVAPRKAPRRLIRGVAFSPGTRWHAVAMTTAFSTRPRSPLHFFVLFFFCVHRIFYLIFLFFMFFILCLSSSFFFSRVTTRSYFGRADRMASDLFSRPIFFPLSIYFIYSYFFLFISLFRRRFLAPDTCINTRLVRVLLIPFFYVDAIKRIQIERQMRYIKPELTRSRNIYWISFWIRVSRNI